MSKRKLLIALGALLFVSGSAAAVVNYRAAIIFGTASSWSGATAGSSSATQGIYWKTDGHPYARHSDTTETQLDAPSTANYNSLPVLHFPGQVATVSSEANCGHYWTTGSNLTQAYYEYWYAPDDLCTSTYVIADGFSGSHRILMGCNQIGGSGGLITVTGNMNDNALTSWSFGSDDGCYPGGWCHEALYYDNAGNIYVYTQGVLSGKAAGPAANTSQSPVAGYGMFFVGGSDHSNGNFKIASLRGVEGLAVLPFPLRAILPDTNPTANFWDGSTTFTPASILLDFTQPGALIPDLANGYNGNRHSCALTAAPNGTNAGFPNDVKQAYPRPTWVLDPAAPVSLSAAPTAQCLGPSTPPAPPRANPKIFDSFTRSGCDSTFALDNTPTLGSTESGSLGIKAWTIAKPSGVSGAASSWGYLNGKAVNIPRAGDAGAAIAWVTSNSATQDLQVDRYLSSWGSGLTGLAFNVTDSNNFNFCFLSGTPATPSFRCGAAVAGTLTVLTGQPDYTSYATSGSWITMRITTTGSTLTFYTCSTNACASPVQVGQITGNTANATGTGVGLFNSAYSVANMESSARYDNFAVY